METTTRFNVREIINSSRRLTIFFFSFLYIFRILLFVRSRFFVLLFTVEWIIRIMDSKPNALQFTPYVKTWWRHNPLLFWVFRRDKVLKRLPISALFTCKCPIRWLYPSVIKINSPVQVTYWTLTPISWLYIIYTLTLTNIIGHLLQ